MYLNQYIQQMHDKPTGYLWIDMDTDCFRMNNQENHAAEDDVVVDERDMAFVMKSIGKLDKLEIECSDGLSYIHEVALAQHPKEISISLTGSTPHYSYDKLGCFLENYETSTIRLAVNFRGELQYRSLARAINRCASELHLELAFHISVPNIAELFNTLGVPRCLHTSGCRTNVAFVDIYEPIVKWLTLVENTVRVRLVLAALVSTKTHPRLGVNSYIQRLDGWMFQFLSAFLIYT
jgi:hypothetical protein